MGIRTDLTNIANAIRLKTGTSISFYLSEMANAISNIPDSNSEENWVKIIDGQISGFLNFNNSQITQIKGNTFKNCSLITGFSSPNIVNIRNNAFDFCSNLSTIITPNVLTIQAYAFRSCYALSNISLPNILSLEGYVFAYCSNLTDIYLSINSVPTITSVTFSSSPFVDSSFLNNQYASIHVPSSFYSSFITGEYWSLISNRIVGDL